jgi:hypothetical protein
MTNKLNIHLGALCDSIPKQLKSQGFKFNADAALLFQKQSDALIDLKFAGILTEGEVKKGRDRLFKQIAGHVSKMNKPV